MKETTETWYTEKALPSGWGDAQNLYFEMADENHLEQAIGILGVMVTAGMADLDGICETGPTKCELDTFTRLWGLTVKVEFVNGNPTSTDIPEAFPVIVYLYHCMRYGAMSELAKMADKWREYRAALEA